MSEDTQNAQQPQDQALQEARDFFGQSMGRILGQMESDNAQLQSYMQQLPQDGQNQVQQMTDSYNQFAGTITQAAQDAGVQDSVLESAQQARQTADQSSGQDPTDVAAEQAEQVTGQVTDQAGQVADQAQDTVGGLTEQAQDAAGQATDQVGQVADQAQEAVGDAADQAQDMAGQMASSLPEGYEALGQPFTDDQGNTILQGQDEEGNTVIVRRGTDEAGNTVDSIFDAQGNLLDENIVEEAAEEEEEPEDAIGDLADSLPEGYEALGQPFTDDQGNQILQGQDEEGNTAIVR